MAADRQALEFARLVSENLNALHRDPTDPSASLDYARSRARQLVELLEAERRPTCTVCGCTSATSSLRAGPLIREWFGDGPVCFDCFSEWYDGGELVRDWAALRARVLVKREAARRLPEAMEHEVRIVHVPEDRMAEMQAHIERLSEALRDMTADVRGQIEAAHGVPSRAEGDGLAYYGPVFERQIAPVLEAEALLRGGRSMREFLAFSLADARRVRERVLANRGARFLSAGDREIEGQLNREAEALLREGETP